MKYCVVFSTAPSEKEARRLAKALLKKKLAACINILPGVKSFYWWKGKIYRSSEVLLIIKTLFSRFSALQKCLKAMHPYEIPEIISFPIQKGLPEYLLWIERSLD